MGRINGGGEGAGKDEGGVIPRLHPDSHRHTTWTEVGCRLCTCGLGTIVATPTPSVKPQFLPGQEILTLSPLQTHQNATRTLSNPGVVVLDRVFECLSGAHFST